MCCKMHGEVTCVTSMLSVYRRMHWGIPPYSNRPIGKQLSFEIQMFFFVTSFHWTDILSLQGSAHPSPPVVTPLIQSVGMSLIIVPKLLTRVKFCAYIYFELLTLWIYDLYENVLTFLLFLFGDLVLMKDVESMLCPKRSWSECSHPWVRRRRKHLKWSSLDLLQLRNWSPECVCATHSR